ncbi:Tolloid protein 2 [Fasciola gigantica]|uniref:Tolloid protein 2 n=1 Tax=Fasciola gigantica TaxID=46835 RepID=A0A504YXN9_FASGI|nr:Tolloid protein 2 [Fasciola gigantica]
MEYCPAAYYPGRVLSPTELTIPGPISTMPACRFRIDAVAMGAEDLSPREFGELPGLTGELISPTYPGFHPDGLTCAYQLIGRPTQRINVDVLDLDLPEHSATCTMDYLYFYDAEKADPESPSIGPKFCGRNRRLRVVSTGPSLLILFVTGSLLGSRAERARLSDVPNGPFKRRGFRLRYTFTDKLLAVHPNHRMWHIRGTECDYLVRSQGSSEAKFESPTYKTDQALLPGRSCSFYFLGGLYDQHMEVVRIGFDELDLPPASNVTNSDQEKLDRTPSSLTARQNKTTKKTHNPPPKHQKPTHPPHPPHPPQQPQQLTTHPPPQHPPTTQNKQPQNTNTTHHTPTQPTPHNNPPPTTPTTTTHPQRPHTTTTSIAYLDHAVTVDSVMLIIKPISRRIYKCCNLGHLAVYGIRSLNGLYQLTEPVQNWTDHFGHIDAAPDHVWCGPTDRLNNLRIGSNLDQAPIVGQHSLILLRLNATGAALPGLRASFRVIYRFDRAFGVPGAPVSTDMCHFLYSPSSTPFSVLATSDSVSKRPGDASETLAHPSGWTNSPFYPSPYPSNSTCLYLFIPSQMGPRRERMRFSFGTFETQSGRRTSTDLTAQIMPFSLCDQTVLGPLFESTKAHISVLHSSFVETKPNYLLWSCQHLLPVYGMKAIAYNFLHIGVGVLLTLALLLGLVGFIYYRERKRRLKMPSDPLAELTGSKRSLASTHPSSQKSHRHQCPNAHKAHQQSQPQVHHRRHHHQHHSSTLHIQSRSHHNSRTDVASTGKGTLTRTGSLSLNAGCAGAGSLSKRQLTTSANTNLSSSAASPLSPPSLPLSNTAHHHHTANTHAHESRLTQTMPHDCASRHQLVPVHEFHRTQPPTSSRLQRRLPRQPPGYGITLSRNGSTLTGSIHSGMVGTGSSGMSVDADGGLLIREKMQKISIV